MKSCAKGKNLTGNNPPAHFKSFQKIVSNGPCSNDEKEPTEPKSSNESGSGPEYEPIYLG